MASKRTTKKNPKPKNSLSPERQAQLDAFNGPEHAKERRALWKQFRKEDKEASRAASKEPEKKPYDDTCPDCGGRGFTERHYGLIQRKCDTCDGSGHVQRKRDADES